MQQTHGDHVSVVFNTGFFLLVFSHAFGQAQDNIGQPGRWARFIGKGPPLPGLVHGTGSKESVLVRLALNDVQHLEKTGILMRKRIEAEHPHHMQDIIPDEGIFQLTIKAAYAKQVILLFFTHFPMS